ncbi:MAG: NAD-dependent epimerase/dehydratase family protein, partial [Alphaproteobacteria bacterium]|nr:NAD-dependent epimerase/dehydratase family protein [Alphaproteobacteria bacterium]
MKVYVTGATGFIGLGLCLELVARGAEVRALCRDPGRAGPLARAGVALHPGSLDEPGGLADAMGGCDLVFHLAALAATWSSAPNAFHRVNVDGTRAVLTAARRAGIRRVIHTSTAAVLGPAHGGPVRESDPRTTPFFTAYEETKAGAEEVARQAVAEGQDVVIVNPTRVYGPTPLRPQPPMNRLVAAYMAGSWRLLPGDGRALGNYVAVADVVAGHLLAAERGRSGERYLLGGEDASYTDIFELLGRVTGHRRRLIATPLTPLLAAAA